ncbi:hypothetical protein E3C22_02700 [Jiella endophytica]|uniref:Radical SAM protein n=1 Tax=Jiella endophytica TaxID=2558362 RepID=A0A4Y8RSW4_9HYPH|nr:hypothetical protein [Jiella endophytica]TFF27385.1 hypothetical protein E3C22_02700 [Jiella endophytica]
MAEGTSPVRLRPAREDQHPRLQARYRAMRSRIGTIVSSNYDISDVCNLTCEGCLYFSGLAYKARREVKAMERWDDFFANEAGRGVNFGYFAGAEPSLVPDVLRAAQRSIPRGVVFTNGIKRLPADIRYRIHISLWGDTADAAALRGASNGEKALRNYSGDARALAVYTINRTNIDSIAPVADACAAHGVPLTFSYFSPTDDYLTRLAIQSTEESDYFRLGAQGVGLIMGREDFERASRAITAASDRHPDTVRYNMAYDRWVTRPEGLYTLDDQGLPLDCGNRLTRKHRHYNVDLSENDGKCCSPNIDCRECRAYAQSYATILNRLRSFTRSDESFEMWLDVWASWADLFLLPERPLTPAST